MRRIFSILFVLMLALAIVPIQMASGDTTVYVTDLLASWTGAGGGGVYSLYAGPPGYSYVSPGSTALYLGREAGIIKAGLTPDPGDGHYWDDGCFAFRDNLGTIDSLAAGALSYDVVNQYGACPVWMTIEIDTGTVGDRSDDTAYQHVPTSNPASWHTVDAAAGQWQKWNNYMGDTTGNPLISLSAVAAAHTGLNVARVYLRLGMGDAYHDNPNGTVGWVDKVTIGTVTYDFVVAGTKTGGTVNFTADKGNIVDLVAVAVPAGGPFVEFPYGMFSFKICCINPGDTVTLTVTLPAAVPVNTLWWKYQNGSWYSLPNLSDNGDNIMVISLTDNGSGDADPTAGNIIDDGGPGLPLRLNSGVGLRVSSTAGGSITTPGEGDFPYLRGMVVNLEASPNAGYKFVNWSGDVGMIADVNDASTTIHMEDWYMITANFAKK